ncbi:aldo/keto reductase [Floricoccus penangensis]|uniref:aldo/keto reductase n=1 Tax=Floricoccus penangensis TaxID=1859475 RepID=UPI00203E9CD8|nr:aldo/keto reductase [Floricoccus penangensis]URZ87261.1 aldo/keto reductase [Floricoccus penangensis]
MKKIKIKNTDLEVSNLILGCMRINQEDRNPQKVIETAYNNGINFFDHADIYGRGECESIFAEAFAKTNINRSQIYLQSKLGIVPGIMFDQSKEHILNSTDKILNRLNTDYLDTLLIHRPDVFVEPEEVAEAFYILKKSGKVKYFGVSNHKKSQIELLKTAVKESLVINQLQFGLKHTEILDSGLNVNMHNDASIDRDDSIWDYSRIEGMTIQAWSPFQYGHFEGIFIGNEKFPNLNRKLVEVAEKYNTSPAAIAYAWINSHPANVQTIIGTMNPKRIEEIAVASDIVLSREEWYSLYIAAGNVLP